MIPCPYRSLGFTEQTRRVVGWPCFALGWLQLAPYHDGFAQRRALVSFVLEVFTVMGHICEVFAWPLRHARGPYSDPKPKLDSVA
ncbi:hypothetical protein NDU88_002339 [Pleurodeles waltl]|uniref:Uncharacterized protein n=1 Tax=Pleurodeles waltl TaxID=8319 RepID=A0AAV7UVV0_PLEWA|nr:hypothetical protein NDU88_002339 [Pleurodeles waltl]